VDEAQRHKRPVVVHAHRPDEIRRAMAEGADSVEHTGLATAPESPPDIIAAIRERAARMNQGPLFWAPTLSPLLNYEYRRDT
jgi:imidazolonepropionase-like amidohydrolase